MTTPTTKKVSGFKKTFWIFYSQNDAQCCRKKPNWFAGCHSVICLHYRCTSVCLFMTCSVNKPNIYYDEKLLSPNMDPLQSMQPREVGHGSQRKLFRNVHIFSYRIFLFGKGTAKLLLDIPFSQVAWWWLKSSTNPSVRFQVGLSQVLSRCSDYWDGHNPGIVEQQDTDTDDLVTFFFCFMFLFLIPFSSYKCLLALTRPSLWIRNHS